MPSETILVTGGAGFIGSNFVNSALSNDPCLRIVVVDALTYAGNLGNLETWIDSDRLMFVNADIADTDLMRELLCRNKVNAVIHFAAESHVDRSIDAPDAFIHTNILGTHSLLKACRAAWLDGSAPTSARFLHVSTDEVYGSLCPDGPPFEETTAYAPNSPYSATKAASDHLVRAYHHTYGLPAITTNCSNNYGPYQHPEKLLPLALINCLQGKPIPVYGDGRNVRDWLYVADHCRAIELALHAGRIGSCYNVGGNAEQTNLDIVSELCRQVDLMFAADPGLRDRYPACPGSKGEQCRQLITFVADRPGHDRRYAVNSARITNELGFAPRESISSGLAKTISWYLENEDWWGEVLSGSHRKWIEKNYDQRARA